MSARVFVRFSVSAPDLNAEHAVHVLGDLRALGGWDTPSSIPLSKSSDEADLWTLTVDLPAGNTFRCRFLVKSGDSVVHWESKPKGRQFTVPQDPNTAEQPFHLPTCTLGMFPPKPGRAHTVQLDDGLLDATTGSEVHLVLGSLGSVPSVLLYVPQEVNVAVELPNVKPHATVRSWKENGMTVFKFNAHVDSLPTEGAPTAALQQPRFVLSDVRAGIVLFTLTDANDPQRTVATATLNLSALVKPNKRSNVLITRDHFLATLFAPTREVVGTLSGEFQIYHPFLHPSNTLQRTYRSYWETRETQYIGHRGLGKSFQKVPGQKVATVRENTLCSFSNTGLGGAGWVELDVQLTKDRVPVVYHDFFIGLFAATQGGQNETVGIGIHELGLAQLKKLKTTHFEHVQTKLETGHIWRRRSSLLNLLRLGSKSPKPEDSHEMASKKMFASKLKEVVRNHLDSIKIGNRTTNIAGDDGASIANPQMQNATQQQNPSTEDFCNTFMTNLPTLDEVLVALPPGLGLNIEIKYPCEPDVENLSYDPEFELNKYLDEILCTVFEYAPRGRRIVFSCFHPDVCTALHLKQARYPVFFLTSSGVPDHYMDIRMNTVEQARIFATHERLQGLVCQSDPFFAMDENGNMVGESLVRSVKQSGLVIFTWGGANSFVDNCETQERWGVDAVICDGVTDLIALRRLANTIPGESLTRLSLLSTEQIAALFNDSGFSKYEKAVHANHVTGTQLRACEDEDDLAMLLGGVDGLEISTVDMKAIMALLESMHSPKGTQPQATPSHITVASK